MSFQVVEVLDLQPGKIQAKVSHQDNQVTAILSGTKSENILVGKSFQAEIRYDEILDWKVIEDFDDLESGIWQEEDGIHVRGRVHSVVDFGDGVTMIDVYIQNGPEVFAVNAEDINNEIPQSNGGLEIVVSNLYLYPKDL